MFGPVLISRLHWRKYNANKNRSTSSLYLFLPALCLFLCYPPCLLPLLCSFLSSFLPFSPSFLSFSCSKNPKLLYFPHFPLVFILLFPLVPARPFCHFVSLFQSLFIPSPFTPSLDEVLLKKRHCPGLSCCCPAAASLMPSCITASVCSFSSQLCTRGAFLG